MKPCSAFALFVFAVGLALGCVGCGPQPQSEPIPKADAPEVAAEVQEPSSSEGLITALIPTGDAPVVTAEVLSTSSCEWLLNALSTGGAFTDTLRVDILGGFYLETDEPWPFEPLTQDQLRLISEKKLTEGVITCELDIDGEPLNSELYREHVSARFDLVPGELPALRHASLMVLEREEVVEPLDEEGQPVSKHCTTFTRYWDQCRVFDGDFLAPGRKTSLALCNTVAKHTFEEYSEVGILHESSDSQEAIVLNERGHPVLRTTLILNLTSDSDGDGQDWTTGQIDVLFLGTDKELALVSTETTTTEDGGYPCTEEHDFTFLEVFSFHDGVDREVFHQQLGSRNTHECSDDEDADAYEGTDGSERWEYLIVAPTSQLVLTLVENSDNPKAIGTKVTYDWQDGVFVETSRIVPEVEPELVEEPEE